MPITPPLPDLDELLASMGEAGARICEIDASEAGVGNISVCVGWDVELRRRFPLTEPIELPVAVPALAGRVMLVTGAGRRLRQIRSDPLAAVGALHIDEGGATAILHTAPERLFERLTSELNSHLAVHDDQVRRNDLAFHAIVHAQPPNLTYLSHIATYRNQAIINRRILRWEPELIVSLPEGLAVLEFTVPGSAELMTATVAALRDHRIVLWCKHGVMAHSDLSATRAVDHIDYAERGAHYEYMDVVAGGHGERLADGELARVAEALGVESPWL